MNYIKLLQSTNDNKKRYYISLLPILNMASKLLKRKNMGKKPFSEDFEFDKVIKDIYSIKNQILEIDNNKKLNIENNKLVNISNKLKEATKQIKSQSLANDFIYLSKQIDEVLKIK